MNASIRRLGLTRIIIAHRPETIASAARCIAMIDGRLHEQQQPDSNSRRHMIMAAVARAPEPEMDAVAT